MHDRHSSLGVNRKFQITGRPKRPCGSLTTSKVYMIRAQMFVFFPIVLDHTDFYMSLDLLLLIDKACLHTLAQCDSQIWHCEPSG
jgi:phosphorylase kinase alpha/beta subunit